MIEPADVVVLSPHLDDAALSCGGALHRWAAGGQRVRSITVFAGDVPPEPPSQIAAAVLYYMGLSPDEAMAKRRAEDRSACAALGVQTEHWSFRECIFRSDSHGQQHYTTRESIFARLATSDSLELVPAIVDRLRSIPSAARVLAPLGVGGHVDHQLLRLAAEQAFGSRVVYFEDYPYVQRWRALHRILGPRPAQRGWVAETVTLATEDLEAKVKAIGAYQSQLTPLFRSPARMRRLVLRDVRKKGGERFWRQAGA